MSNGINRSRLLPWYIGAAIIFGSVIFLAEEMLATPAPTALELGVLIIIPLVYLTLMYLTLKSQD